LTAGVRRALDIDLVSALALRFDDGAPVRAASGITAFEDGWLVVSDDATHAALWTERGIEPLRLLPAVAGHEVFDDASGTKRLKPDLEAACRVQVDGDDAALLLGSGSLPNRMRAVLVTEGDHRVDVADLEPLYRRVAGVLDLPLEVLNLEGACVVGDALRWFQRGNAHQRVLSASVDVDLAALLDALLGRAPAGAVPVSAPRTYDLANGGGADLAVTDAVALPGGEVLVVAVAEDTMNAVDDGPVTAAGLFVLDGDQVVAAGALPAGSRGPHKVEGLAVAASDPDTLRLVAVVDADDPEAASTALELLISRWQG
jgi:hypothetical protein